MSIQPGVGYTFTSSSLGTNFNIEKPWAPWANYNLGDEEVCPLTTYNVRKSGEAYYVNITPGMVNNLVVKSDDGVLLTNDPPPDIQVFSDGLTEGTTTNYIYIRCGNSASSGSTPAYYPARSGEGYPCIRVSADDKIDNDEYSWIMIAVVTGTKTAIPDTEPVEYTETFAITKTIGCNSLWTERFKCGTSSAIYWWSAV